jgi:hypothetical protein
MAKNIGTLVTAAIRPNDSLDPIASAYANEIMGGLHRATASSDRNAIISARREWGMLCYVINDNKTYQLTQYNSSVLTDNTNWVEFSGSGGGGGSEWINSVLSVLTTEPLSPADGDRYLVGLEPTDTITGTNWNPHGVAGFVAQWSSAINDWNYTTPLDGMSLRVDNQDNSIYRYEGDYPTGSWQKEKVSQVRYINATSVGGASYSSISSPYLLDYDTETLYIVKFDTTNIGGSVSLSINGLPHKTVRKTDGVSLTNIISNEITTNYQYLVTYNGIQFELLNPSTGGGGSGLLNKYFIDSTETITVPTNTQYWIYGDLGIDGTLDNYGQVVVVNGSLNVLSGSFNNAGTYSNLYFAEINGLGQYNYVPRWVTPYMLTATSSIYDDTYEVTISSPTFSVLNDVVLSKGATDGYVLTSDSNGLATWQQSLNKYSATFSFVANATQSITHNLNSSAIVFDFWNEITGYREYPDIVKTGLNTIDVMSTTTILNGRVVIIS